MSWLRRAIEPDPLRPRYLKTIRGMGYRLDLPGPSSA
jgi:DNA-binding response OmpR family regulator